MEEKKSLEQLQKLKDKLIKREGEGCGCELLYKELKTIKLPMDLLECRNYLMKEREFLLQFLANHQIQKLNVSKMKKTESKSKLVNRDMNIELGSSNKPSRSPSRAASPNFGANKRTLKSTSFLKSRFNKSKKSPKKHNKPKLIPLDEKKERGLEVDKLEPIYKIKEIINNFNAPWLFTNETKNKQKKSKKIKAAKVINNQGANQLNQEADQPKTPSHPQPSLVDAESTKATRAILQEEYIDKPCNREVTEFNEESKHEEANKEVELPRDLSEELKSAGLSQRNTDTKDELIKVLPIEFEGANKRDSKTNSKEIIDTEPLTQSKEPDHVMNEIDKIAEAIIAAPKTIDKKFNSLGQLRESNNRPLESNYIKEVDELYSELKDNGLQQKEFDIGKYVLEDYESEQADRYNYEYSEPSFRENETEDLLAELQRALRTHEDKVEIPKEEVIESYNTPHFSPNDEQVDIQDNKKFDSAKSEPTVDKRLVESDVKCKFYSASSCNNMKDFMTIGQFASIDFLYDKPLSFKENMKDDTSNENEVKVDAKKEQEMSLNNSLNIERQGEANQPIEQLHKYIIQITAKDELQEKNCLMESLNNEISERAIKCMLMESLSTKNRAEKSFFVESMNEIHNSERLKLQSENKKIHKTKEADFAIKKYLKNILHDPTKSERVKEESISDKL